MAEITQAHVNAAIIGYWRMCENVSIISVLLDMPYEKVSEIISDYLKSQGMPPKHSK